MMSRASHKRPRSSSENRRRSGLAVRSSGLLGLLEPGRPVRSAEEHHALLVFKGQHVISKAFNATIRQFSEDAEPIVRQGRTRIHWRTQPRRGYQQGKRAARLIDDLVGGVGGISRNASSRFAVRFVEQLGELSGGWSG